MAQARGPDEHKNVTVGEALGKIEDNGKNCKLPHNFFGMCAQTCQISLPAFL